MIALPRDLADPTYRGMLRTHWTVARWALGIVAVVAAGAVVVVANVGTPENSMVGFARQGLIWFPFSMALIVIVGYVNVHVAMGQTRRALARASVLAALTLSVAYALAIVAMLQLERGVYALEGWHHVVLDESAFVRDTSQVGLLLLQYLLAAAAGHLCGLLCGIVYYRVGGWWGTLALPLTVGPIAAVQAVMAVDVPFLTGALATDAVGGALIRGTVSAAILAVVVLAFVRILRTTPIRTAPLV